MLARQKIILNLIKKKGRPISRLQIVKWAFILSKINSRPSYRTFYEFVPYLYGPFSFNLYHEISTLIKNGYLTEIKEHFIELGEADLPEVCNNLEYDIDTFLKSYGELNNNQLLNYVYKNYPWFTINSLKTKNRRMKKPKAQRAIYTTGYEGLQVDKFLNLLLKNGIEQVIDVRRNPTSRRYGYHKSTLLSLCQKITLGYEHFCELGITGKDRANLNTSSDYDRVFNKYEKETLSNQSLVDSVIKLITAKPSVIICSEKNPAYCHRTILAKRLEKITGLPIYDIRCTIK